MTALLDIRGLQVRYGGFEAVRGLDLSVAPGETVALVGESGCGKSTSALAIMGLLPMDAELAGVASFDGQNLLTLSPAGQRELRGGVISMIFQDSMTSLNPVLTVGRQIIEVLKIHTRLRGHRARERAIELLALVEIPEPERRVDSYPHEFSGGQRQRIAIAMAVACNPRLLIADEPTTALDVAIQGKILELLDRLKTELGMGLLLITHDLGLVGQWADRVAIMLRGTKVEEGTAERIFSAPEHPYTRMLLGAALSVDGTRHYSNSRLAELGDTEAPRQADPRILPFPVPRAVQEAGPAPREPLLTLTDIHAGYVRKDRDVVAVNGVSLEIGRGETLGLVGESGCGKSTLSRAILRVQPVSAGRILFEGRDITHLPERELHAVRPRMQMIFQDPHASLNPRHRVIDIMHATLSVNGMTNATERHKRIIEITDRVQLPTASLERYPHEFSGGQKQRIGIARALLLRPSLLICDEPASSLDLPIRAQVLNLLGDLKAEFGLSYLFISHDLSVVRYMADRVAVMRHGKIVELGDHQQIWERPQDPYTRSLIDAVPHAGLRRPRAGDTPAPIAASRAATP
jgi:peptide/nickel transport system ATP-binding protein